MMEKIEQERETTLKEIRSLNETLEKLTGKPHVTEEAEVDEIREDVQVTPKLKRNKSRRASDVFPSFMRPTASSSSRRLSGTYFSVISHGPGLKSRRNSMISVRAESVCLPMKKNGYDSVCDSSERSVSKSTCVMRADDAATVDSQDISECDIKLVVSEHKPKGQQMGHGSAKKPSSSKMGGTEFSRVNSWLHSQSANRSYLLDKKQLPATPSPVKARSLSRNRSLENSSAKLEDIEESRTEETVIKPTPMLKDLFELQCLCSSETEDQILSKYPNPDNDGDNNVWEQGSLKPRSQRGLAFPEDIAPPLRRQQVILGERGKLIWIHFCTNANAFVSLYFVSEIFCFWLQEELKRLCRSFMHYAYA